MMKVSDIPFNMKTSYNSAFHEGPNDIDEMKKGVDFLFEKLSTLDDEKDIAIVHLLLGHFLRVLSQLEDSLSHFRVAYKYFHDNDDKNREIDIMYRMGVTYYFQDDFSKCDEMLQKVIRLSDKFPHASHDRILHHTYFYLGQSKKSQGVRDLSEEYFSKCLELRLMIGDVDLIKQCQDLIMSLNS